MSSKTWKPKNEKERNWLQGVNDALALVAEWDKHVNHDFRLSDCIKLKLNLVDKNKVQRNVKRVVPHITVEQLTHLFFEMEQEDDAYAAANGQDRMTRFQKATWLLPKLSGESK